MKIGVRNVFKFELKYNLRRCCYFDFNFSAQASRVLGFLILSNLLAMIHDAVSDKLCVTWKGVLNFVFKRRKQKRFCLFWGGSLVIIPFCIELEPSNVV